MPRALASLHFSSHEKEKEGKAADKKKKAKAKIKKSAATKKDKKETEPPKSAEQLNMDMDAYFASKKDAVPVEAAAEDA